MRDLGVTWTVGIDIGSLYSKGVLFGEQGVAAFRVTLSGTDYRETALRLRQELIAAEPFGEGEGSFTVATGIGADNVPFANQKASDLVCTARGIGWIFPLARTVIEVSAQTSKVMQVDEEGRVTHFTVSEKCAAGSGRFVDVIANVLRTDLNEFGPLSLTATRPISFGTGCAVFGESEAITRVAEGIAKEDIAAGVHRAIASKVLSLSKRIRPKGPWAICGGGALNIGLVRAIEEELGTTLLVPPHPQITAALGAAVIARTSNPSGRREG